MIVVIKIKIVIIKLFIIRAIMMINDIKSCSGLYRSVPNPSNDLITNRHTTCSRPTVIRVVAAAPFISTYNYQGHVTRVANLI